MNSYSNIENGSSRKSIVGGVVVALSIFVVAGIMVSSKTSVSSNFRVSAFEAIPSGVESSTADIKTIMNKMFAVQGISDKLKEVAQQPRTERGPFVDVADGIPKVELVAVCYLYNNAEMQHFFYYPADDKVNAVSVTQTKYCGQTPYLADYSGPISLMFEHFDFETGEKVYGTVDCPANDDSLTPMCTLYMSPKAFDVPLFKSYGVYNHRYAVDAIAILSNDDSFVGFGESIIYPDNTQEIRILVPFRMDTVDADRDAPKSAKYFVWHVSGRYDARPLDKRVYWMLEDDLSCPAESAAIPDPTCSSKQTWHPYMNQ